VKPGNNQPQPRSAPPTRESLRFLAFLGRFRRQLLKVLVHPIFVFVVLQIVCVALTVILVIWYVNKSSQGPYFDRGFDLMFLITGCILSSIILVGTVLLFVFAIRQSRLNKQQRSFVSSVTHELRSPIASMQLSLETLQQRDLEKDVVKRMHQMILTDLDRLVALVDQILVSARLDRGINVFDQVEPFAPADVIKGVMAKAGHLDPKLQERVHIDCDPTIVINTARPAVELVFANLLENAVKYSPPASKIEVTVTQHGRDVILSVADSGFGMDKRDCRRVFKIFHRAEIAHTKAIPGTGLGLYIVKTVCRVLGGRAWAESPGLGRGSTFFVTLPVEFNQTKGR